MTTITYEDYWAMMCDWSQTVIARANTGNELLFEAIFDNEHKNYMDSQTGEVYSSLYPHLVCRTEDVKNLDQDESIKVNCTEYRIRDYKPNSWGISIIDLQKTLE